MENWIAMVNEYNQNIFELVCTVGPAQTIDAGPLVSPNNAFYDNIGIFPIVNVNTCGTPAQRRKYDLHYRNSISPKFMFQQDSLQSKASRPLAIRHNEFIFNFISP